MSSGLSVATSMTVAVTPSPASASAAASVSCTIAPQLTSVMSLPSRSVKQVSSGSAAPSSATSWRNRRYSRVGSRKMTGSGSAMAASSSPYARAGDEGTTTRMPGICANIASGLSE
ncbi:hypothetical protein D3C87_1592320 [compost metagenome]